MIKPLTEGKTKHDQKCFDTPKPDIKPHGQRPCRQMTDEETRVTLHKVYRIYPLDYYGGYSLIAADSVDEANKWIEEFRNSDLHNDCDSYGYSDVSEVDLEEGLFSTRLGFVIQGIYYTGN